MSEKQVPQALGEVCEYYATFYRDVNGVHCGAIQHAYIETNQRREIAFPIEQLPTIAKHLMQCYEKYKERPHIEVDPDAPRNIIVHADLINGGRMVAPGGAPPPGVPAFVQTGKVAVYGPKVDSVRKG